MMKWKGGLGVPGPKLAWIFSHSLLQSKNNTNTNAERERGGMMVFQPLSTPLRVGEWGLAYDLFGRLEIVFVA